MQLLFKFSPFLARSKTELQRKHSPFILDHPSAVHTAAPALLLARYFWTSHPVTQYKIIKLQRVTVTSLPVTGARHICWPGWVQEGALQLVQFVPAQLSQLLHQRNWTDNYTQAGFAWAARELFNPRLHVKCFWIKNIKTDSPFSIRAAFLIVH